MTKVVLDSSAFLAVANNEAGADKVLPHLPTAVLSAVNYTEVLQKLVRKGMNRERAERYVGQFIVAIIPFDVTQAARAAIIAANNPSSGLSLGDCACLALAQELQLPVLTADQAWGPLQLGITVELIRPPHN